MASEAELKIIKRRQGTLKAKVTNLKKLLDEHPAPSVPSSADDEDTDHSELLEQIQVSAAQLIRWLDINVHIAREYEDLHNKALAHEDDDNLQARYLDFNEFDTRCTLKKLNDLIESLSSTYACASSASNHSDHPPDTPTNGKTKRDINKNPGPSSDAALQQEVTTKPISAPSAAHNAVPSNLNANANSFNDRAGDNVANLNGNSMVQLPVLNLQKFEGQCEQFNTFYESFKSLIHNNGKLSTMSKFLYLKNSLGKEPLRILEHLDLLEANYEIALSLLEKRYRDIKLMIHTHIRGIISCPSVSKGNNDSLRVISDSIQAHLRALETLGEPIHSWSSIIQYIVLEKLDFHGKREWEIATLNIDQPCLKDLFEFLEKRCHLLEKIDKTGEKPKILHAREFSTPQVRPSGRNVQFKPKYATNSQTFLTRSPVACCICKGSHYIYNCRTFLDKTIPERVREVKRIGLCENCLRPGHSVQDCKSQHCKKCTSFHATLLHPTEQPTQTVTAISVGKSLNPIQILPTAEVLIHDNEGKAHKCIALLDCASQSSYITNALCQRLKLPIKNLSNPLQINGIESIKSSSLKSRYCTATIKSRHTDFTAETSFVLLNNIANRLPCSYIDPQLISFPSDIKLANPNFQKACHIDILLGLGVFWAIVKSPSSSPEMHPLLQNTQLGYVVSGELSSGDSQIPSSSSNFCALSISDIALQLSRFWDIEKVESKISKFSPEEVQCETHFVSTTTRDDQGRFTVQMPLCAPISSLGESKEKAFKQFKSLERRLTANNKLKIAYADFMNEYISLGHMTKVKNTLEPLTAFYIPHHPVFKPESLTTKLRVVFNSSAQSTNGISLNDIQLNGPTIQDELFSILIRFRRFPYILSADCTKMYRCVNMHESHRGLQRIFWRADPADPLDIYELNTVTYGQKCSSFLAIRCLFELANKCEASHPQISKIIRKDMYCDDLLTSCQTLPEASYVSSNISKVLSSGGFTQRKWNSNDPQALNGVRDDTISNNLLQFGLTETVKTLGLVYHSYTDSFLYDLKHRELKGQPSKRAILSFMSSIFDPLGLISPCIITLKIFMQRLWSTQGSWDEPLSQDLESFWCKYHEELKMLDSLQINRQTICTSHASLELHAFSDASERAYGACVYLKSIDSSNNVSVHLLCSKTKVAPLKTLTIPKLELCAGLLMTQLVDRVKTDLDTKIDDIYYWTDSTIVLSWVQTSPHLLSTFISNRISQIQQLSNAHQWNHVPTTLNPADSLSRGLSPSSLQACSLWWHGPGFLFHPPSQWPKRDNLIPLKELPELKTSQVFVSLAQPESKSIFPFAKYSNVEKMTRIMAYVLRFVSNCQKKVEQRTNGHLRVKELDNALMQLGRLSQQESFSSELHALRQGKLIDRKSNLITLTPFLSVPDDTLRVRGRLLNSQFSFNKMHPLILCGKHHFTRALFSYYHKVLLHGGPQLMLCTIRERFWPIGGPNLAKRVYRECLTCFRCNPKPTSALMGNLPSDRVTVSYPFSIIGTDYCGPFYIKDCSLRKYKLFKAYVCLFVCFSTKAVHLEVVADLTTEAFISTLRAFASRRGMPSKIFSDNGSNYVGAKTELHQLGQFLISSNNSLPEACAKENFEWHFIPPYAPNMGGIWEAGVKSCKAHLKRVVGETKLTYIEFYHVLTQIESILNSRPLSPLSANSMDLLPLTPAHFLIGRPLTTVPDPNVLDVPENRLSKYQNLQKMVQNFWSRWAKEYISELQQRCKWNKVSTDVKIDTLVLIKEDNTPPNRWQLGRIQQLHPGKDGITRVASIQVGNALIRRSLAKICPLPDQQSS